MSRRSAKPRAASGKAFANTGSSAFGAFASPSGGSTLSYLTEPPDLSAISDANIVVSFKNLLKKDATTKSKALEDLIAYVEARPHEQDGGTEEPILEAWVQVYPRISIDNSRRVRELSHTLQLELMKSARKRTERHVPKIVASWLAGTFDRDRVVSRVATEGLSSFLTTPDKVVQFWRRCQPQILEYALDAIVETTDTLSDERSTSVDDAETKYHRVLGGSLALVLNLLQKLDVADLEKHLESYDRFFEVDKVWNGVTINDVVVRRLTSQLVVVCLKKRPNTIEANLRRLSKVYISEGLKSNQQGSAADFISALTALTSKHPTIWTSDYHGKRSPAPRLKNFLEKGSQGSAATVWDSIGHLLSLLDSGVIPTDLEESLDFMKSMRSGITGRDEPRSHAVNAWTCYLGVGRHFIKVLASGEPPIKFIQEALFPLTEQYLFPLPERSVWGSGSQIPVLIRAYTSTTTSSRPEIVEATKEEWSRLKDEFKDRIRNSLPEASKDHGRSQKAIADEGSQWFILSGKILEAHKMTVGTERPIPDIPLGPSLELVLEALKLLKNRNWKPFGAAATVEAAIKNCGTMFQGSSSAVNEVLGQLEAAIPDSQDVLLSSPSMPYIISCINTLSEISGRGQDFKRIWKSSVDALLSCRLKPAFLPALVEIISNRASASLSCQDSKLQDEIIRRCIECASGSPNTRWDLFDAVLGFDALSEDYGRQLARELVAMLSKQSSPDIIKALLLIAQKKSDLLSHDKAIHMSLMTSLLSLSEQSDAHSEVDSLRTLLSQPSTGKSNFVGIIQQNVNDVGPVSLGIETLVHQAMEVQATFAESAEWDAVLESIMPDTSIWSQELSALIGSEPNPSLSLTSSLGGSYFLVSQASGGSAVSVRRDRIGCSIPGRMAMYTSKFLSSGITIDSLSSTKHADLLILLGLTAEVATDQLTVLDEDEVWKTLDLEAATSDAENLISSSRRALNDITDDASGWRDGSGTDQSRLVHDIFTKLLEKARHLTPLGFYSARVLSQLLQNLVEKHGFPSSAEGWLMKLDVLKSTPTTVLPAVAILTGLGETLSIGKAVSNFCNRLVSDAAGAKLDSDKSLTTLVLLNACMPVYEVGELPVANNRLVFAVRQITSWLETPDDLDYRFAAEACRSLRLLLPCIKDVFGSYWERSIDFCTYLWTKDSSEPLDCLLPYIHASLRLMTTLYSLEDPNDDLVDALQSSAEKRASALIELLRLPRDEETQPLEIVDTLICRQVEQLPLEHVEDLSDLYGLVAADSRAVQTAAFTVLHKALPAAQDKLSVDVLLDKNTAQLPDELLSLLLEAPTLEAYSDEALVRFPTPIRSYLLTWHLVFDTFEAASFKLRGDYAENLKAANYIGPLMEFTFDVLGHSAAHGLNLDKANLTIKHIREYDLKLADAEIDERNMQWLLIHLYYLVLKYVPGLFKTWFIECRSKPTKIAVESWMTKYFSPIIISEALDDVSQWAATQEPPGDDEKELIVKVSRAAKEITAGYEVDELEAAITIRIPPAYPLEGVSVVGINRVAVNERKWQSWIMTTQGVITFSGGSIIDGLAAFRRNVVGALKGQTECAICYSIISSDKKMPDKRCGTCKNLFHRTCLYKWFQSSNQNTCPLCRNPIDYLGADTKARRNV
ncbi:hypothetical protein BJ170DRAFT_262304 [Xylariales sp. AK1849]|nr:hypothetical protein BJ170DRAFT_262304 [Xylariales sp. AK1849]